jgi:hypothetical protein
MQLVCKRAGCERFQDALQVRSTRGECLDIRTLQTEAAVQRSAALNAKNSDRAMSSVLKMVHDRMRLGGDAICDFLVGIYFQLGHVATAFFEERVSAHCEEAKG